jgi:hypothetical protein
MGMKCMVVVYFVMMMKRVVFAMTVNALNVVGMNMILILKKEDVIMVNNDNVVKWHHLFIQLFIFGGN